MIVASVLGVLSLGAFPAGPAAAQSHVVVPIVIRAPRASVPSTTGTPTVKVTTQTTSPRVDVTATRVTVTNTTGAPQTVGTPPGTRVDAIVPSGTRSVLITVDRSRIPNGTGAPRETRVTIRDVSHSVGAAGGRAGGSVRGVDSAQGGPTLIITSEAPIDAPIVILAP
jgi:hypothetical protein